MTCANVLQDVGTAIYVLQKRARLVYQSTAAVGAVLKTKGNYTTEASNIYYKYTCMYVCIHVCTHAYVHL